MTKGLLFVFFTMFLSLSGFSQKAANVWHFGNNTGLDFNGGSPVVISNPVMDQLEGSASISDAEGNLLFYTDGMTVWNRSHIVMTNGTGLMGHQSASQSALIVPLPNSDSIFYIFTVPAIGFDSIAGEDIGLRYSIVNMSAENGSGAVISKNTRLLDLVTEKLAAIMHCNNRDVWVVTTKRNTNNFYAYNISPQGISLCPVISAAGQTQMQSQGYLKFSPDGSRLVTSSYEGAEILKFDRNTGVVTYESSINETNFGDASFYGASFSPDNTKLYLNSGWWGTTNSGCAKVVQYDVTTPDPEELFTIVLDNYTDTANGCLNAVGAIQLGPDGKIYITGWEYHYLHIIENPNMAGAGCNFIKEGIYLNGSTGKLGLPNFIESYFDFSGSSPPCEPLQIKADFTYMDSCSSRIKFVDQTTSNLGSYSRFWNFGNPGTYGNTSTKECPEYIYNSPGTYQVSLIVKSNIGCTSDTITKEITINPPPQFSLGMDTVLCEDEVLVLDAYLPGASYLWQDNSTNSTFNVVREGIYSVNVELNNCIYTDTLTVEYIPKPAFTLGEDITMCQGDPLTLNVDVPFASYLWQDGSGNPYYTVTQEGIYSVLVEAGGCSYSDTVKVQQLDCELILLMPDLFTPNGDGSNDVFVPIETKGIVSMTATIYNRWGSNVFTTDNPTIKWDGTNSSGQKASEGVYFWAINFIDMRGNELVKKGYVSLLR